ncbi:hypothetical protein [Bacillus toyonensis]|uniref:hypothetical protein n=1 Tax=Bacillus toyonensis TaxID=155322 RepID=UPI000BEF3971|nr:hypothetical protein [Bacillus toyonensis]PEO25790.1 hypothetical protein CN589_23180 [Bacillus toyonensis]PFY03777.1 hypothetical protein COL45_08820 [Bacillus toyonensis]PHB85854.1 hypothetical protein COE93_01325 [Bacillus toyonensis]
MNALKENKSQVSFFKLFFKNHPIKNDVFVIEANEKHFFFEYETVINMIEDFSPKQQEYIKRQLRLYNNLNQDLSVCLVQIASDYVRRLIGEHKKIECRILPLHSIYNHN